MTHLLVSNLAALLHSITAIAYRPFLDPIPIDDYWLVFLLPLVLAVAVVYKAIKLDDLSHLPKQALHLAGQIIAFMVLAAAALWLLGALV